METIASYEARLSAQNDEAASQLSLLRNLERQVKDQVADIEKLHREKQFLELELQRLKQADEDLQLQLREVSSTPTHYANLQVLPYFLKVDSDAGGP